MANLNTQFAMEEVRELVFSSIVDDYMGIGTATDHPCIQFLLQNLTNATLMFSITNESGNIIDNIVLPATGFWDSDIATNQRADRGMVVVTGTRFYVKRIGTPTSGSVYLSICYAK